MQHSVRNRNRAARVARWGRASPAAALALLLAAAACSSAVAQSNTTSSPEADPSNEVAIEARDRTTRTEKPDANAGTDLVSPEGEFECPVTIPPLPGFQPTEAKDVGYSKAFPRPDPYPSAYPGEGMAWYGSNDLWTALPIDGDYEPRKSVWWSVQFPGGTVEAEPEVRVTWTRLDAAEPHAIDNHGQATNAHTADAGWFMIAGIDPDQSGCWKVEATYKDATLSYVYQRR